MTLPASGAITFSQIDVELGYSATAQIGMNCSAVRTLFGQGSGAICMNTGHGKSNTSVPGAPTGVSASATSCSAISVSFSAPSCTGHLSIDYYQVVCTSSGSKTATGSSSPISVSGLCASTSYTFKVRAHNSKGYGCYSSSTGSATTSPKTGSCVYTSAGTYSWVAPAGVTSVSVVAVGPGGGYFKIGGGQECNPAGGGLGYKNNISVSPGSSYTVHVGLINSISSTPKCLGTWFINSCTVNGFAGIAGGGYTSGGHIGDGGGNGGTTCSPYASGAGAGGYSGNGANGHGGGGSVTGGNGSGGGGGAGGWQWQNLSNFAGGCCLFNCGVCYYGGGGGGVGLYGQGSNGTGASPGNGGGGGSGGGSGRSSSTATSCLQRCCSFYVCTGCGPLGGSYGGAGGGQSRYYYYTYNGAKVADKLNHGGKVQPGALRIVYPGSTRTFPSTCVGSP